MKNKFTKIITHAGTHHADEVLAIATVFKFAGKIPVERKSNVQIEDLENPEILILDIGGRLEPEKGNFDHHQDRNIPATNMLVLNHFCNDEKLKELLRKHLFSYVDAVDRGMFPERPDCNFMVPDFNSQIRWLNNVDDGFNKAIETAEQILPAAVATAKKSLKSEEIWNSLEKYDGIAIQHTNDPILGWHVLAERDGILLRITPNNRIRGSYQVISWNSKLLVIPQTDEQLFRDPSGYMAGYSNFEQAYKYATEIKNAYIYQTEHTL